ncbi:glutamate--cysteine ligase isoform X3 [Leptinotarsa decemlineata]|uniref:glutamate--cysteine ligase isoform X3 n=1 Tax=Leptinotarsa decemlineata TaxID=7539 RepID=UPI003D306E24
MGLLNESVTPLSHEDTMKYAQHVREHGITQFISLYKRLKDRQGDVLKWGDEIEYSIIKFDHDREEAKVSLRSFEVLGSLNEKQKEEEEAAALWGPEYAAYMIEGTPGKPYGGLLAHFNVVEANMKHRRKAVGCCLESDEALMSITTFPRLGCENFSYPSAKVTPNEGLTGSLFIPDSIIHPGHPRYKNTTNNIRQRRGEKPYINLPIFMDENTNIPVDNSHELEKNALPDCVYLDAMGFGSGYSCLQVTFQACNITEARVLYDQLAPFCPILMALTAAAPFHRGFITDIDCRWDILKNTSDCRTEEERGLKPLKNNKFVIPKSRYDSINSYLSPGSEIYNDVPLLYHQEDFEKLLQNGVDELLAKHIAHLFIRDTISMFAEKIHQDDEEETDHFEIDENISNAQKRNAVVEEKFWFRHTVNEKNESVGVQFEKMTVNEIVNGKKDQFPGLIPIINNYLSNMEVDADTHCTIQQYLKLIEGKASGKILTTASWMRKFVLEHSDYRKDSKVTEKINYDLLRAMVAIETGERSCPELLGCHNKSRTCEKIPTALINGYNQ